MSWRKVIFWLHLILGVAAGLVIAVLAFTGCALALRPQVLAWTNRAAAQVALPPGTPAPLPLDELMRRARAAEPDLRVTAVTVLADPRAAVAVAFGRDAVLYLNPYTGAAQAGSAGRWRAFFQTMESTHRWLALADAHRAAGRAVTGAATLAFFFLAVSGLYLWAPRSWNWRSVAAAIRPGFGLKGRARDWNWHTVTGFWCALGLVALSGTGVVMSYTWANNLLYRVSGSPLPSPTEAGDSVVVPTPAAGARPLSSAALLAAAEAQVPRWSEITLRVGGFRGGAGGPRSGHPSSDRPRGGAAAVTLTVREANAWPRFASIQLALDPFTGKILRAEGFGAANTGRRLRQWARFLHTGEAFGLAGQLVAGVVSLGGCLLVVTGLSLAFRRLLRRRRASRD